MDQNKHANYVTRLRDTAQSYEKMAQSCDQAAINDQTTQGGGSRSVGWKKNDANRAYATVIAMEIVKIANCGNDESGPNVFLNSEPMKNLEARVSVLSEDVSPVRDALGIIKEILTRN